MLHKEDLVLSVTSEYSVKEEKSQIGDFLWISSKSVACVNRHWKPWQDCSICIPSRGFTVLKCVAYSERKEFGLRGSRFFSLNFGPVWKRIHVHVPGNLLPVSHRSLPLLSESKIFQSVGSYLLVTCSVRISLFNINQWCSWACLLAIVRLAKLTVKTLNIQTRFAL